MSNDFFKAYAQIINEDKKNEVEQDWDDILNACVEDMKWKAEKAQAVKDLIQGFKNEKYKIEALTVKIAELKANSGFIGEIVPILQELENLNINMDKLMELSAGCQEMVKNANYEHRRNFIKRVTRWLDKEDAKDVVKLAEICAKLRKIFKKYCCND